MSNNTSLAREQLQKLKTLNSRILAESHETDDIIWARMHLSLALTDTNHTLTADGERGRTYEVKSNAALWCGVSPWLKQWNKTLQMKQPVNRRRKNSSTNMRGLPQVFMVETKHSSIPVVVVKLQTYYSLRKRLFPS